jgi:RNA exonuclease 1
LFCSTQVRAKFLSVVGEGTILVGHSLDNDLRCLRVVHMRIADTSLLFPHTRGPPLKRSLRELAATYLKLEIQNGEHCSVR